MNNALLLDNLDLLAEAPGGVPRLRGLILQLAVQGRLVEQDPADEPASMLLRSEKSIVTDSAIVLPSGWVSTRIGHIVEIIRGVSYKKEDASEEPKPGFIPVLRANNIGDKINLDNLVYVPSSCVSSNQIIREHDIIVAMSSGSKNLVGKAAQASQDYQCSFGAFCGLVRIGIDLYKPYIGCYFRSPLYRDAIAALSKGIGINNLQRGSLEGLVIPLPPLAEQRRIVECVDQLMAMCDGLEARQARRRNERQRLGAALTDGLLAARDPSELAIAWARLRDAFDLLYDTPETVPALRQAILQLAVQGRLVEQDPSDEPAELLLRRIQFENIRLAKERNIKFSKENYFEEVIDVPFEVPDSWRWVYLEDICYQITDGAHHTPTYITSGVYFLSVKDISSGVIDLSDTKFISENEHNVLIKRCKPEYGDVLLTKVGTTGIAKTVDVEVDFSIFVSIALLKFPQKLINSLFLEFTINSPLVKEQSKNGTQGVGNKNLVLKTIKGFVLPLPPLAEQRRIVARVEQLLALCDDLEAKLRAERAAAKQAAEAICQALGGGPLGTTQGRANGEAPARRGRGRLPASERPVVAPARPTALSQPRQERMLLAESGEPVQALNGRLPADVAPAQTTAALPGPLVQEALDLVGAAEGGDYALLRALLLARGTLTSGEVQQVLGLDPASARALLRQLVAEGLARVEGQRRGTRYVRS